jgi:hypothetical protein
LRCSSAILNSRNWDAIDTEHASVAAHMLARYGGQALDEAVAFVGIVVGFGFDGSNVAGAHGYEHPARGITRVSNVEAQWHRWAVIEKYDILLCARQNERGQRQSGAAQPELEGS